MCRRRECRITWPKVICVITQKPNCNGFWCCFLREFFFSFMIMAKVFHFYFESRFFPFRSVLFTWTPLLDCGCSSSGTTIHGFLHVYSTKTFKCVYEQLCILTCTDSFFLAGDCFNVTLLYGSSFFSLAAIFQINLKRSVFYRLNKPLFEFIDFIECIRRKACF